MDGIVLSRHVEVGQVVTGNALSSPLFVIATDLARMQVDIDVSEADIGQVKVGQKVSFTVDAYPERTFSGIVQEIHLGPTIRQNAVYYGVVAGVDNSEWLLRPEMTADVRITTARREQVLCIPTAAVKQQAGNTSVEVLQGKDIQQREVITGLKSSTGLIEILSGLREGERVILSRKQK